MRLLVLGGTGFLGRHVVATALEWGHELTLFNRGRTDRDAFPELETVRGDRLRDLGALEGRSWDALVDTCGYEPRDVRVAAAALGRAVERYVFVSSIAVYTDPGRAGLREDDELAPAPAPLADPADAYGPLKAECERVLDALLPARTLHVRPTVVAGAGDPTERFVYWPRRIAEAGDVLVPGPPGRPIQFVDVRDLAAWIVTLVERRRTGPYNVAGPAEPLSVEAFLQSCARVAGTAPTLVWVDAAFLLASGVDPWSQIPFWPGPGWEGFVQIDASKGRAEGLGFRPVEDTIRAVLEWDLRRPADERRDRLSRKLEEELLRAWNARAALPEAR